eukprot:1212139-Amphidinium_carterae.1
MAWQLADHGITGDTGVAAGQGTFQQIGAWILDVLGTIVEVEIQWQPPDCFLSAIGGHVADYVLHH